ncbi:MAG: hypothetical protein V4697_04155 [Patescibacteria group bacterium]
MALDRHHQGFILEEIPDPDSYSFQEKVSATIENRLNRKFYDKYRFSRITQATIRYGDSQMAYDYLNDQGQGTLRSAVSKSAQELLVNSPMYLMLDDWLRAHAKYARNFVRDSVSSIDEEELDTLDTTRSEAEESWIDRLKKANTIRYGIRPRQNPYAFVGSEITHKKRTVLVVTARYHLENFDEHKVETVLSIPIEKRLSLTAGFVYKLHDPEDAHVLVRLNKGFKWGGAASLGVIVRDTPKLLATMTIPW